MFKPEALGVGYFLLKRLLLDSLRPPRNPPLAYKGHQLYWKLHSAALHSSVCVCAWDQQYDEYMHCHVRLLEY